MKQDMEHNSDWLDKMKAKGTGLKVPDGYFEDLETRVMSRLTAADLPGKVVPIKPQKAKRISMLQVVMASAAAFTLLIAAWWFIKPVPVQDQAIAAVTLSEADIEAYLLENAQDLELHQLAMLPKVEENEFQASPDKVPETKKKLPVQEELSVDDLDQIINDLTEEELEDLYNIP